MAQAAAEAAHVALAQAKLRLKQIKREEKQKIAAAKADYRMKLQQVEQNTERARRLQQKAGLKLSKDAALESSLEEKLSSAEKKKGALDSEFFKKLNQAEQEQGVAQAAAMQKQAASKAAKSLANAEKAV